VVGEQHVAGDIALTLPFVSSLDYATDSFVEPRFSARIDGALLELKGRSKPFSASRESEFELALDGARLPGYFDYVPAKPPVKLTSGTLDTWLKLGFSQQPGQTPRLTVSGNASVGDLKITESAGQALAAWKRLDISIGSADVFGGRFVIDKLALDGPEISARAGREGKINWLELLSSVLPPAADSGQGDGLAGDSSPVEWSLAEATLTGGALRWNDESRARAFRAELTDIGASLKNLDSKGSVADFELAWKAEGGEALKIAAFAVREGKLDLARRRVSIGGVSLDGAKASVRRTAKGRIEWIEPPALRSAEVASARAEKADGSPPWVVEVEKAAVKGVDIRFEDAAVSPRAAAQSIEGLSLELARVSSEPGKTADLRLAFKLNRKGEVAVNGKLSALPLDADLNVDLKTVELLPLQPYFADKLNIAITRGYLSAGGKLAAKAGKGESGALSGSFAGQATVGDFQAVEAGTADRINPPDFLRWKSFHFGQIDARFGPESASIGDIALSDFFARVIVSPEGKLNLFDIVREEKADAKPEAAAVESSDGKATAPVAQGGKPALPVKIGKITLQGGDVRFTDNFVKPNYSANLREIGGSVTGLSSEPGTQASLELRGSYDKVAPLEVSARINPLSAKPYLDLTASVKGIELTTLSTYAEKYVGYAIDKGKLSLSIKYKIENDQLEAENQVCLDQLSFGKAVESASATSLPVRLAASLLKNRKGEIDLNVPVSGSLNDPQFSVGSVIVKVIVNLITKAITSPFALLGSMFGGEELSRVDFDPGRAALTPDAVGRLENLSRALVDKPDLKFEIEGRANPDKDTEGLKRARLDRKVRALKRKDAGEKDNDAGQAAEVAPREYPELLERVYGAESFPKPRDMLGLAKSLPDEEMEKLFLANTAVGGEDLKNLADRRAKAVRDWLVAHDVPAERIFLLPSRVGPGDEGESGCGAEFSLK
jgi:outer membrane protein OmpA-like peptidoglycan-associated protein